MRPFNPCRRSEGPKPLRLFSPQGSTVPGVSVQSEWDQRNCKVCWWQFVGKINDGWSARNWDWDVDARTKRKVVGIIYQTHSGVFSATVGTVLKFPFERQTRNQSTMSLTSHTKVSGTSQIGLLSNSIFRAFTVEYRIEGPVGINHPVQPNLSPSMWL